MKEFDVELESIDETIIYGIWMKSNDKTISKDIQKLSKEYYEVVSKNQGEVLPFYVLTTNYKEKTGDFQMLIGGNMERDDLEHYKLKQGKYAKITVKPKLGFLWGTAIGEAKKFFYKKWIPERGYKPLNVEYEFHTEKSLEKSPTVDLIFGISE